MEVASAHPVRELIGDDNCCRLRIRCNFSTADAELLEGVTFRT